ncbi:MAG TPA: DUF3078 domain-containing protein [Ferruginibacter sp.]|jgi:hypothetical protein|nr:DUF3078 domain-containing protein [Ferruginibacter sp.]
MKKLIILSAIIAIGFAAQAQDLSKDVQTTFQKPTHPDGDTTRKNGWLKGAVISLSATQISNSDWLAAGGDEFSLTAAASLNAFASKRWDNRMSWDNNLDVNYGLVNTSTLGVRKVNDRIDYVTKVGYEPKKWTNVKISVLGQFRSQLTDGYDYAYLGSTTKRRNSGFLAPAYVVLAPGVDWTPTPWLSIFASPAATRWTIVSNGPYSYATANGEFPDPNNPGNYIRETPLATLYGVDTLKGVKTEFGAFVTISMRKDIFKNVKYIGRVDLYSDYLGVASNVSILSTNQFLLKVNKWLQVTYEIDFLDDDNIKNPNRPTHAEGLQVLSTLGIGFAAKL